MHILIHGKWKNNKNLIQICQQHFAFSFQINTANITERTDTFMCKHDFSAVTVKGRANVDAAG